MDCNYESREITKDTRFDEIIGHIEDLLMEEGFYETQKTFFEKYWDKFEPVDENKLVYTEIFDEYNKTIETYIISYLQKVIPNFSMDELMNELTERRSELEGEVFEILSTLTDFMAFKEMILDYRAMKEGKVQDLSTGISITVFDSTSRTDETPPSNTVETSP